MQGDVELPAIFVPVKRVGQTCNDAAGRFGLTLQAEDGTKYRLAFDGQLAREVYEMFLEYRGIRSHQETQAQIRGLCGVQSHKLSDSPKADGSPHEGQGV